MSWSATQLKYQLLRISEILMNWAKFNKSNIFSQIRDIRTNILVESYGFEELETYKSEFWEMIQKSGDTRLYAELKSFFDTDDYSKDPTSVSSLS